MVVEILHGSADEALEPPVGGFPVGPHGVERLAHVGAVSRRHEALQVEREILPSDAGLERARRQRRVVLDEGQAQVGPILVGGTHRPLAPGLVFLQLGEHAQPGREVDVRVQLQPFDDVGIASIAARAEAGRVVGLDAFAQRRAERDVTSGIGVGQRQVLQAVQGLRAERRIGQRRPVLLPAVRLQRGPLREARDRHREQRSAADAARGQSRGGERGAGSHGAGRQRDPVASAWISAM